ncbi:hypothetical protein SAMN04490207_3946 [Pseudomonas gessardii]|nr:hypothetical protein SAMN04490207_0203 [Pseudomonas gessardii]SDR20625.1 hypothetical protein SAMN04490207_3946 [Pseudomonas gessardii]
MAASQPTYLSTDTPPSRASPLPQGYAYASRIRSAVRPPRFACDFDLRRPVKPRWPSSDIDLGGKPAGRRFSRAGPWMAHRGGPPNQCRMTGTPSLGEVPSGGARALWLLWGFSKVTRRQGGTLSGRYRSNGYVLIPKRELCRYLCCDSGGSATSFVTDPPLSQASQLLHLICGVLRNLITTQIYLLATCS